MTTPEKQLIEAQRILDGTKCPCGEYGPELHYEPGCVFIRCQSCGRQKAAPDFEIETCLKLWEQN